MNKELVICEDGRLREARYYGDPKSDGNFKIYQAAVRSKGKHIQGEIWNSTITGNWYFLTDPHGKNSELLPRNLDRPLESNQDLIQSVNIKISDIKRNQKELNSVGLSIALISHGIKNILEGLQSGVYVVDEGIKDGDMKLARKGWDIVKRNIFDITDVAQNILYSSKNRLLNYQTIDPNKLAEETVQIFKNRSLSMNVSLECIPDNSLTSVSVDSANIRRLLQNLVWNAIEACINDTTIKSSYYVYVRSGFHDKTHFKFEIEDNGMGMDETTKKNIFEEFFSTKGSKGTGLGLWVVDKIVNRHGGWIEVESTLGQGALFRIILPIKI
jgi:signal transduction histidine kinase